jgi:8-oxo-dGTP pyrophosphatase MutT (NUDIX family)
MSCGPLETDPRFWVLSEALASYASDGHDPPILAGDQLQAAVSLVLRGKTEIDLLLVKRAKSERDPWSGHMALPGGRRDYDDMHLLDTARRETLEETGVDLERQGIPLGRLDDVAPNTPRLPSITITPLVFGVRAAVRAYVASHEIVRVLWVPVDQLRAAETHSTVEIPLPGGSREFPCYRIGGDVIWGLTYRILAQFIEIYPHLKLEKLREE